MSSRRPLVAVLSLVLPAAIVVFAACSDQAEGERCDTRNTRLGSDDCQPGLVCVPSADLGSAGADYCENGEVTTCGVCCPADRNNATVSVCELGNSLPGADAAAPTPSDAGDAAADAEIDAAGDDAADSGDAESSDAADAADDGPG